MKKEFVMKRLEDIMQHACAALIYVLLLAYICIINFYYFLYNACMIDTLSTSCVHLLYCISGLQI